MSETGRPRRRGRRSAPGRSVSSRQTAGERSLGQSAAARGSCPACGGRSRRTGRPMRSCKNRQQRTRWTNAPWLIKEEGMVPMPPVSPRKRYGSQARGARQDKRRIDQSKLAARAIASSAKGRGVGRKGKDWLWANSDRWRCSSYGRRSGARF